MKKFHQACCIILSSLFLIMTITSSASAFTFLIPAQIPGAKHVTNNQYRAVAVSQENDGEQSSLAGDEVVYQPTISDNDSTTSSVNSRSSTSIKRRKRNYKTRQRTGDLPDVHWRSIPMSHLRCHPNFQPLPPPSSVNSLPTREHVRYFRQESWQWDYLHRGRCTTSQAAAALGFLESKAAVSIRLICYDNVGANYMMC